MEKNWLRWLRPIVATIGITGGLAFAAACVWSFVDPVGVERMARQAILVEVQKRVDFAIDALDANGIAAIARRFSERERAAAAERDATLRKWAREMVVRVCNGHTITIPPADEAGFADAIEGARLRNLMDLNRLQVRLAPLIRGRYDGVVAALLREFRIFTGTNAFVLFLLAAAALARRESARQLLPVAVLVVIATAYVSWSYLFRQDWLHAILFGKYVGLSFVGYVGTVALLLWDIAFNRARLSRHAPLLICLLFAAIFYGML